MRTTSIGDLAQSFMLRRHSLQTKTQLAKLTEELSTGQVSDISKHLSGSLGQIGSIEHQLTVLQSYRAATNEAKTFTTAMQSALEAAQSAVQDLTHSAIIDSSSGGNTVLNSAARGALGAIVSALNSSVAGRSIFAGAATDQSPLLPTDLLLNELESSLSGVTTASGLVASLNDFFDTPGGVFESIVYKGADSGLSPFQIGQGEEINLDLRADHPAMRNALKNAALLIFASDAALGLAPSDRSELMQEASQRLISNETELTKIRSELGYAESRIHESSTRNSVEINGLNYARSELVSADPFETASKLEAVQFQLETIYTLTSRASRLNLLNFLT